MIRRLTILALAVLLTALPLSAGPYVTEYSGVRWNDVGGVRWNDVGGVRWNDVGGVRWNDVGGVRWNDVGGIVFIDSQGVRWNDVGGVRWNDVGSIEFEMTPGGEDVTLDLGLLPVFSTLPDSSSVNVIVSYEHLPGQQEIDEMVALGVLAGKRFHRLPMLAVNATKSQIQAISELPGVRSIWADRTVSVFDDVSSAQIGLPELSADPELRTVGGQAFTGDGVTIAVLDSGVDASHPDLPYGTKVVENVRLNGGVPGGIGFAYPAPVEGVVNSDLVLGHGTFVASVAAGSGAASAGLYAGVAPEASLLGLSAGDFFIIDVLEGFDYILDHAIQFNVRVVNCSWGSQGWFDPDDPVNIATRQLHDAGITVVFAAGNHGPSPDTLNPYAVAPWVVGVGSVGRDGRLSEFSSRGIREELLYHPTLVAPGQQIIAAKSAALPAVDGVVGVADPTGGESVPPQHQSSYALSSGTSFSAPHVSGAIALMLQADPTLTPATIKRRLQESATPEVRETRAAVGAGRLDAWAAVAATVDGDRPFGTHVPSWLDQRPYRITHLPAQESDHTVPLGGSSIVTVTLDPEALSVDVLVAWGDTVNGADLDLELLGPTGESLASAASINALGLFGRSEGVQLTGDLPATIDVVVTMKAGLGPAEVDYQLRVESTVGDLPDIDDVAQLAPADRRAVLLAVSRHLMTARDGSFEPDASLRRDELARSLALGAGLPQRVPGSRTFSDVRPRDSSYPFVETVAGARVLTPVMSSGDRTRFRGSRAVRRMDFVTALVLAAGLEPDAEARAGESLGLADDAQIPVRLRGHAAIAIERGWIDPVVDGSVLRFGPTAKISRLEAAASLLALLEALEEPAPPAAPAQAASPSPARADRMWLRHGKSAGAMFRR